MARERFWSRAAALPFEDMADECGLRTICKRAMIWVNSYFEDDMTQPFGGYKQSGNSRDRCFESILEYTQMKSAWVSLS